MAGENEGARDSKAQRIKERDSLTPSPKIRAEAIWKILNQHQPRPTFWDLICFSIETISLAVQDYPFLARVIMVLNQQIYAIHYESSELFESFIKVEKE